MLRLRPALPDDLALVHELVVALAQYENLLHEVDATAATLGAALFGPAPRVFCEIAEWDSGSGFEGAGLALWFYNFSTFRGRHGIYLEDLFVRPAMRDRGIGRALLARLARRCVDEGLARLEWAVLDWNEPSRRFYESLGAQPMPAWVLHRLSRESLLQLAQTAAAGESGAPDLR